jgi:predicted DNA-binding transcriptional regulator AlpA
MSKGRDAAKKKAAARKRAEHARAVRALPPTPEPELTATPRPSRSADHPARLLDKSQVCEIANVTFPTIWAWMRAGKFPRARVVGGKSMWIGSEVDAWLSALPMRRLKGDDQEKRA